MSLAREDFPGWSGGGADANGDLPGPAARR
jgi:hypothetical protein